MAKTIFITGTDTGVGKTHVARLLLAALSERGLRCVGMKPVAAGAVQTPEGLRNEDALVLQAAGNVAVDYESLNPYVFAEPVAPHIAAADAGVAIDRGRILAAHRTLAEQAELVIVEGAGGWQVPLDAAHTLADLAASVDWPVLLVVGMRLGCLNHALLSAQSILASNRLIGWVANCLPPAQPRLEDNIEALASILPVPLLGKLPPDMSPSASSLELDALLAVL